MNNKIILPALALSIGYLLFFSKEKTIQEKRNQLIDWAREAENSGPIVDIFTRLTEEEINYAFDFIFNYLLKNKSVMAGSKLEMEIMNIVNKYNLSLG